MKKKEILKLYNEKIKLINKFNNFYYNKSKPIISDSEFDSIKNEILSLETKYDFLKSKKSPSKSVGHKPSKNFKKVSHRAPMLSLSNAFTENDLLNFEKKNIKFSF